MDIFQERMLEIEREKWINRTAWLLHRVTVWVLLPVLWLTAVVAVLKMFGVA